MKDYKSLADTYSGIYKQVNENVQIVGIPDSTGEQQAIGSVSDEYYDKLKRIVLSQGEGGTEYLVKSLLRECDWPEVPNIDGRIMDIFLDHEIDLVVLDKILKKKREGNLGSLSSYLPKDSVWNLSESIDPLVRKLSKDWKSLFKSLCGVQPKIDNVSTGPGEIAISMFTDAKKGTTSGDLYIDGVEVEVKGAGGRLGSSDYTKGIFNGAENKYLAVLKGLANPNHFATHEKANIIRGLKFDAAELSKKIPTLQNNLNKWFTTFEVDPITDPNTENIEGELKYLQQNLKLVIDNQPLTQTMAEAMNTTYQHMIDMTEAYPEMLEKGAISGIIGALGLMDKVSKKATDAMNVTDNRGDYNWQDSAQYMFNYDYGMSPLELATAFVEMRTEPMDQGSVASLIQVLEKKFKDKSIVKELLSQTSTKRGGTTNGQRALQKLQIALMATSYQSAHGFPYLLAINPHTLNAFTLKFKGVTAGDIFEDVYKQLVNQPNIIASNPAVDTRNKGIGISLDV